MWKIDCFKTFIYKLVIFHSFSISVMEIVGGISQDFTLTEAVSKTHLFLMLQQKARLRTHPTPRQGHGNRHERSAPPVLRMSWNQMDWVGVGEKQTIMSWGTPIFWHTKDEVLENGTVEHPLDQS